MQNMSAPPVDFDSASSVTDPSARGPFADPVLRCDACQKLVRKKTIHKLGCCHECGNKRFRNVNVFNGFERDQILEWGFAEFLKLFEVIDDE
jgi:hypothetical protein